jgi:Domain of unknown function (DUF4340)
MNRQKLLALGGLAALLLIAGIWLSSHRARQQSEVAGGPLFADLKPALGEVAEIRFSKGDGSRTTLRRAPAGWTVVERGYPADGARVRELLLGLVSMKVVEHKTSDPANYAKLGVEAPDSPTATSTLLEVVAGKQTWSLIVGKSAEGRALYVRKPGAATSELVEPGISADPDQKRWVDRLVVDLPGANVHDIAVTPASGPAYLLTRAKRGDADLVLSPVPKGRTAASAMSIDGQADALAAFNFDDVRALPATATATDRATYRTFDGQVLEFSGRRDGPKAYVSVSASHDAALAAQFAPPAAAKPSAAAAAPTATPTGPAVPATPATATAAAAPKPAFDVERLAARAKGVEFEIPVYKYESIFKPQDELLEKKPLPTAPTVSAKKTVPIKKK